MDGRVWWTWFLLAGLFAPAAWAQESEPADQPAGVELSASFFSRFELRQHYSQVGLDGSDAIRYRARFGLASPVYDIGDRLDLRFRIAPQASGFWHIGGSSLEDPLIELHEGLLEIFGPRIRADVGRFELVYGDHLVIGNVDWHHSARAFDGVRLRYQTDPDGFWVDAFGTVLHEGLIAGPSGGPYGNPFGSGDEYFTGLYSNLGPLLAAGYNWDLYALGRIWPTSDEMGRDAAAEAVLGTRVKHRAGAFDYRLEAGVQLGSRPAAEPELENPDVVAYQADLELGVNAVGGGRTRVALEGFYASGDDPESETDEAWDQLFPTAHKWLGFMDIIGGRSNVAGGVFHLAYWPVDVVKIGVDTHLFYRPQTPEGVDAYQGVEIDTGVVYTLGQGLRLRGAYDIFLPGEDFPLGDEDPFHFVELELRYDM